MTKRENVSLLHLGLHFFRSSITEMLDVKIKTYKRKLIIIKIHLISIKPETKRTSELNQTHTLQSSQLPFADLPLTTKCIDTSGKWNIKSDELHTAEKWLGNPRYRHTLIQREIDKEIDRYSQRNRHMKWWREIKLALLTLGFFFSFFEISCYGDAGSENKDIQKDLNTNQNTPH